MQFDAVQWDFSGDARRAVDVELENRALTLEVERLGGTVEEVGGMTPALRNAFLKQVLAYEATSEEPGRPIRDLFPEDLDLPPAEALSKPRLGRLLKRVREILSENNIELGLVESLPEVEIYRYLTEEVIPKKTVRAMPAGTKLLLDGCSGWCEECFQEDFCEAKDEW